MSDLPLDDAKQRELAGGARPGGPPPAVRAVPETKRKEPHAPRGRSFFDVYKRGQGRYTRGGSALGAGVLIAAGANFVYEQLEVYRDEAQAWTLWVQAGVTLAVLVGLGLLTFWLVYVNRRACDFMIATEGEMKKVNWSSRREIVGSTKVVIMFTILLAAILFVVDIVFMSFFAWIEVLHEAPSIMKMLFGDQG